MRFTNETAIQLRHDFANDSLDMKLTKGSQGREVKEIYVKKEIIEKIDINFNRR